MAFRWFKFTLKPPHSITSENFLLAIWYTSHWKFCSIWTQDSLQHLLWHFMASFDICQVLATPGPFKYFSKIECLQKIKVFLMKEWQVFYKSFWFYFGRYLCYMMTSFGGAHLKGYHRLSKKVAFSAPL